MKNLYLGLIRAIGVAESVLCYAGLVLCSLLVVIQVVNRYILHYEIMWLGDLSLYFFVPMMILSISLTSRAGGHTTVDVFVDMAFAGRPSGRKMYGIFVDFTSLAVLLYLLPMSWKLFTSALEFAEYGTLVRWFNTSWIRESVLVMVVLCIIHTVHGIGLKIFALRASLTAVPKGGAQ